MELPSTGTILERHLSAMVKEFMGEAQIAYVVVWGTREEFGTQVKTVGLTKEQAGLAVMSVHQEGEHGAEFGFLPEDMYIVVLELNQAELVQFLMLVFVGGEHLNFSKFGASAVNQGCGWAPIRFQAGAFEYMDK